MIYPNGFKLTHRNFEHKFHLNPFIPRSILFFIGCSDSRNTRTGIAECWWRWSRGSFVVLVNYGAVCLSHQSDESLAIKTHFGVHQVLNNAVSGKKNFF